MKLRRVLRFTKCGQCVEFRAERLKRLPIEAARDLQLRQQAHHREIQQYRGEALRRALDAHLHPGTYLSIAQDAVDATQKGIPKTLEFTKAEDSYKLKSKVMVNMVHGESVHFYVMPENVHGGPNESAEALHRTLAKCKKSRGQLPPILFLQVDNSARECKNTYILACNRRLHTDYARHASYRPHSQ